MGWVKAEGRRTSHRGCFSQGRQVWRWDRKGGELEDSNKGPKYPLSKTGERKLTKTSIVPVPASFCNRKNNQLGPGAKSPYLCAFFSHSFFPPLDEAGVIVP